MVTSGNINNIFDWLNEITYNKRPWSIFNDEEKNLFNLFLIHRFISMNPEYIDVVHLIQQYPNCSKKKVYEFYCNVLPKKKSFFRYIKSSIKHDKELINELAKRFECSTREVKEYLTIIDTEQIKKEFNLGQPSTNKKRRKKS
jgi:hypothetical protein